MSLTCTSTERRLRLTLRERPCYLLLLDVGQASSLPLPRQAGSLPHGADGDDDDPVSSWNGAGRGGDVRPARAPPRGRLLPSGGAGTHRRPAWPVLRQGVTCGL